METWPLVACVSFLATVAAVPLARRWALRANKIDIPNQRSSHKIPTPRIGGIGIVAGALAGWALLWAIDDQLLTQDHFIAMGVFVAFAGVGLLDDILQLSVAKRMPLYLLGAFVIASFCYRIEVIDLPLAPALSLHSIGSVVFSILFISWYTNLFNFMDGTDGIAAGAAVVTCGALTIVFSRGEEYALMQISLALSCASLSFLMYNYSPASIFMGDIGSVFLGAACGTLTIAAIQQKHISLVGGVLLMFPFVFDATFTLIRRALNREKIWQAHRSHIYQQLCDLELSHRAVAIIFTTASLVCAALGLYYDELSPSQQAAILLALLIGSIGAAFFVLTTNARRKSQQSSRA